MLVFLTKHLITDTFKKPKLDQLYNRNKTPLEKSRDEKYSHKARFFDGRNNSLFLSERSIFRSVSIRIPSGELNLRLHYVDGHITGVGAMARE